MADPQDRRERVVGALGAVIIVALAVGAVVGALTYGVVRVTGLAGGEPTRQSSPSVRRTPEHPARSAAADPAASTTKPPQPTHLRKTPSADPQRRDHRAQHRARERQARHRTRLTLSVGPRRVREMGRVNLWGRYPGHNGARLLVRRFEGGRWGGFPVTVTVRGGRFHTWVASGRRGANRFRVLDPATSRVSPTVTVSVY